MGRAVALVAAVLAASLSVGALASLASRIYTGVALTDALIMVLEAMDRGMPRGLGSPAKAVTEIASSVKSAVTGEPVPPAEPLRLVQTLEAGYVYMGILLNNLRILASPALIHSVLIAATLAERRLRGRDGVRGGEAVMAMALLPLGINGALTGSVLSDYPEPELVSIGSMELLALSLVSLIAAEAKLASGGPIERIRGAYGRYWRLIPLAVMILAASAAGEAWLIKGA